MLNEKTTDLFLEGQNWFLSKEMWVRLMSSSATSTSGQSGNAWEGRFHPNQLKLLLDLPAIMECTLSLSAQGKSK
jgi:hypothetical protein